MTADTLRAIIERARERIENPSVKPVYRVLAVEAYGENWRVYVDVTHWPNTPTVVPKRLASVGLRALGNGWDCAGFYLLVSDTPINSDECEDYED